MPLLTLLSFLFLGASFLSLWVLRDPKIWGSLLGLSMCAGLAAGHINLVGLSFVLVLLALWVVYDRKPILAFFIFIVVVSIALKMRFLPGYTPFMFTPKFAVGLEGSLIGLFPLAFLVPLAKNSKDWKAILKGLLLACGGIAILAMIATFSGVAQLQFKLPSFAAARILSNLFLTSIPEEGFYRGFLQKTLCKYLKNFRFGSILALVLTSVIFTAAHIYWSPNLPILLFVFFASMLYGSVYMLSGKIENAILCHFLLNLIHMIVFSYHAM